MQQRSLHNPLPFQPTNEINLIRSTVLRIVPAKQNNFEYNGITASRKNFGNYPCHRKTPKNNCHQQLARKPKKLLKIIARIPSFLSTEEIVTSLAKINKTPSHLEKKALILYRLTSTNAKTIYKLCSMQQSGNMTSLLHELCSS